MFLIGICSAIEPAVKTTEAIPKQVIVGQIKQNIKQIIPKQGIVGRIKQMNRLEKALGILLVLAVISSIISFIMMFVVILNQRSFAYGSPEYDKYNKMSIISVISIFISIFIAMLLFLFMKYKCKHRSHCVNSSIREHRDL